MTFTEGGRLLEEKVCTKCGKLKELSEYYTSKGKHVAACIECAKKKQKLYRASHKKLSPSKEKSCRYCMYKATAGKGMCNAHYIRVKKYGDPLLHIPVKWRDENRKEGWYDSNGYRVVHRREHPNARRNNQLFEHVLVMSSILGRPLLPHENVHHKNGVRDDNRPENLELWSKSQPPGQRVEDKVAWATELLRLYKPEALAKCSQEN